MASFKKVTFVASLLCAVFVSGCAPEKDIILEGKRQDVFTGVSDIKIDKDMVYQTLPKAISQNSYSQYLNNYDNTSNNALMKESATQLFNLSVSKKENSSFAYVHVPVVLGDTVFVSSNENVRAYSISGKSKIWTKKITTKNVTTSNFALALDEALGHLYVVANDGTVLALNIKTGAKIWSKTFNKPFTGSIANKFGMLYLLTSENELFALDSRTGDIKWQHKAFSAATGFMSTIKCAFVDDIIIVPYNNGEVYALNALTGKFVWQDTSTKYSSDFSTNNILRGSPVVGEDNLILTNPTGVLKSVNMKTERVEWALKINPLHTPAKYGDELFVITTDGIALNANNGKIRWATNLNEIEKKLHKPGTELDNPQQWTMPVLAGNRLFFFSSNNLVVTLDPKTGSFIKALSLDSSAATTPIVVNGTMLVMLKNGNLFALK